MRIARDEFTVHYPYCHCRKPPRVRISTALGTYAVEILNDFGPIADGLTAAIERAVLAQLHAHRHLAEELATVEIQRAEFDYEARETRRDQAG
jgi:hypothetical protein